MNVTFANPQCDCEKNMCTKWIEWKSCGKQTQM